MATIALSTVLAGGALLNPEEAMAARSSGRVGGSSGLRVYVYVCMVFVCLCVCVCVCVCVMDVWGRLVASLSATQRPWCKLLVCVCVCVCVCVYRWYNSWEEAKDVGYKLEPSMFCTPEKQKLPLERCMRFLPHHQVHTHTHDAYF